MFSGPSEANQHCLSTNTLKNNHIFLILASCLTHLRGDFQSVSFLPDVSCCAASLENHLQSSFHLHTLHLKPQTASETGSRGVFDEEEGNLYLTTLCVTGLFQALFITTQPKETQRQIIMIHFKLNVTQQKINFIALNWKH